MMRHILNGILVRKIADPQKCSAPILIADRVAAFGVHMHVAKMNVLRVVQSEPRRETVPAFVLRDTRDS